MSCAILATIYKITVASRVPMEPKLLMETRLRSTFAPTAQTQVTASTVQVDTFYPMATVLPAQSDVLSAPTILSAHSVLQDFT